MEKVKKHLPTLALVVILFFTAYLRLHDITGYMTFLGDEGRDVLVVKRMIVDHKFTLLGPTASVGGFFLGPIYYYFMLPFLWLWKFDPTGPAVMVALFGIATVYLVYRLGKELANDRVGLVAASLYALSPVVIAYSRSSWNPNLVPFFSTLFIYVLWWSVKTKRFAGVFWAGVIFGIGIQLHYLFLFLFPVAVLWFFIYGRSRSLLKYYFLGLIGILVGYSPFLAFEVRHGFPNTISVIRFVLTGKDTGFSLATFFSNLDDVSFRLFGRLVFRFPQPEILEKIPQWKLVAWVSVIRTFLYVSVGLLFVGIFVKKRPAYVLLFIWFITTLVLFGFYKLAIYDYYFGILFVLPFLLVGVVLSTLAKFGRGSILAGVIFVLLVFLNWQGRPFFYPPNNQLAQARHIAQVAYEKTEGRPYNFALITNYSSDHEYRYFFEIWGNKPVTIENEAIDPQRKTVTDQLIVICELSPCQPLGNSLWEIAGFGRAQIAGQWDVPFVKIYKLTHYQEVKK